MLAPTIDDTFDLAVGSPAIWGAKPTLTGLVNACLSPHLEQVNFGNLPWEVIEDAAKDMRPIVKAGLLTIPYESGAYRFDFVDPDYERITCGSAIFFQLLGEELTLLQVGTASGSFDTTTTHVAVGFIYKLEANNMETDYFETPEQRTLLAGTSTNSDIIASRLLTEFLALTLIFQARGVPKVRTAPPAKPNAARAKRHRPLLPYTTVVDARPYTAAVTHANTGGCGTHASPRPHFRRAHVRQLASGRATAVSACVVGWDGISPKPTDRKEYRVLA